MSILEFALIVGRLKVLKRTGWVERKIPQTEYIADHIFGCTMLGMLLGPVLQVDENKLLKMLLLHDLPKAEIGEVVLKSPEGEDLPLRISNEKKGKEIIATLFKDFGNEYSQLFQELLSRQSKEARIAWEIDRLERTIQAYIYEKRYNITLSEFFESAETTITTPLLKKIVTTMIRKRKLKWLPEDKIVLFMERIEKLKTLKRTGWVQKKVKNPETVAGHIFGCTILAMIIAPLLHINQKRLIEVMLVHDTGEAIIGDVVVERFHLIAETMKERKEAEELEAIQQLFSGFGSTYSNLFIELITRATPEAKVGWDIDKLDRSIQAFDYEEEQDINLREFFGPRKDPIQTPQLLVVLDQIEKLREKNKTIHAQYAQTTAP